MYSITAQSGKTTAYVTEYQVYTLADLIDLPKQPICATGSLCLCLEDTSVWCLGDDGEWHAL